jgi:hypothetical protein
VQALSDSRFLAVPQKQQPGDRGDRFDPRRRRSLEARKTRPRFPRSDRTHGRHPVHANDAKIRYGSPQSRLMSFHAICHSDRDLLFRAKRGTCFSPSVAPSLSRCLRQGGDFDVRLIFFRPFGACASFPTASPTACAPSASLRAGCGLPSFAPSELHLWH